MKGQFSYAPVLIASERTEPMTAAEHASRHGHVDEFIRDVPASCSGAWKWDPVQCCYKLIGHPVECAWHAGGSHAA